MATRPPDSDERGSVDVADIVDQLDTLYATAAALGAALGDLLPGESTGTDITRALETELSELFERSK